MSNVIWAWVTGQETKFEISSDGRIRSYLKMGANPNARLKIPREIKPCMDSRGYYNFTVRVNGIQKTITIHSEMGKLFIPNPNSYPIVRHLNDIKTDNRIGNLCWGTHKENRDDGIKNGKQFHKKGCRAVQAKLNASAVKKIVKSTKNNSELGRQYSVSECTISKIRTGRTWGNVTGLKLAK